MEKTKSLTFKLVHLPTCVVIRRGLLINVALVLLCISLMLVYRPGETLRPLWCLLRNVVTCCRFLELNCENDPRVVVTALLSTRLTSPLVVPYVLLVAL